MIDWIATCQNRMKWRRNRTFCPSMEGRRGGKKFRYGWELKLKAVQLHRREGDSQQMVSSELRKAVKKLQHAV